MSNQTVYPVALTSCFCFHFWIRAKFDFAKERNSGEILLRIHPGEMSSNNYPEFGGVEADWIFRNKKLGDT